MSLESSLRENSYPGRGIVAGLSADGKYAVCAYFIMGRSVNSRNRVFVEVPEDNGIETRPFDMSKLNTSALRSFIPPAISFFLMSSTPSFTTSSLRRRCSSSFCWSLDLRYRTSSRKRFTSFCSGVNLAFLS